MENSSAAPESPPQLCDVRLEHLDMIWPHVEPLLEEACRSSRGRETAFDIRRSLRARDARLWVWWDHGRVEVLAITEIARFPRKTIGRIKIATALPGVVSMDVFRQCTRVIEAWARSEGATGMAMDARPGWARILKGLGYETTHHFIEKDFPHA